MKKIISIFTLLLLFSTISFAQPDDSYKRTVKRMFNVMGSEEIYEIAIVQMLGLFKDQYPEIEEDIWDELEDEFLKKSLKDLTEMLSPVYYKHFSENDLKEIIAFYQTPIGQKFVDKTPLIMKESMEVGEEWGKKIGEEFVEKMKKREY